MNTNIVASFQNPWKTASQQPETPACASFECLQHHCYQPPQTKTCRNIGSTLRCQMDFSVSYGLFKFIYIPTAQNKLETSKNECSMEHNTYINVRSLSSRTPRRQLCKTFKCDPGTSFTNDMAQTQTFVFETAPLLVAWFGILL